MKKAVIGLGIVFVCLLGVRFMMQAAIMFGEISPPPALAMLLGIDLRNSWTGKIVPLAEPSAPTTYSDKVIAVRGFSSLAECSAGTLRHADAIGLKDAGVGCGYKCSPDAELKMDVCWNTMPVREGGSDR